MAFISLFEARGKAGRRPINYDLLGYSIYNMKTHGKYSNKYLVMLLTPKCLVKANMAIGDFADLLVEPTTGEVVIQRVEQGGWKLYKPSPKSRSGLARFRVPISEMNLNLPEINSTVEIKNVHIGDGKIIFNFNQLKKFVKVKNEN